MYKTCKKCYEIKHISEFSSREDNKDGYKNICKICEKKIQKAYRERTKSLKAKKLYDLKYSHYYKYFNTTLGVF
jgi:hypothetical protein